MNQFTWVSWLWPNKYEGQEDTPTLAMSTNPLDHPTSDAGHVSEKDEPNFWQGLVKWPIGGVLAVFPFFANLQDKCICACASATGLGYMDLNDKMGFAPLSHLAMTTAIVILCLGLAMTTYKVALPYVVWAFVALSAIYAYQHGHSNLLESVPLVLLVVFLCWVRGVKPDLICFSWMIGNEK